MAFLVHVDIAQTEDGQKENRIPQQSAPMRRPARKAYQGRLSERARGGRNPTGAGTAVAAASKLKKAKLAKKALPLSKAQLLAQEFGQALKKLTELGCPFAKK